MNDIIFAISRYTDSDDDEYDIVFFVEKSIYERNACILLGITPSQEIIDKVHEFGYFILSETFSAFEEDGLWESAEEAIKQCENYGFIHDDILQEHVNSIIQEVGKNLF